jgi:multiple sugar transport system substrate-binding protein
VTSGTGRTTGTRTRRAAAALVALALLAVGCGGSDEGGTPTLTWYVFDEPSGSFAAAAERCTEEADGEYRVDLAVLPADADQQREQLARRLAAGDTDIDIIGMDVIWTAEFAEAGWILPWEGDVATAATEGRIEPTVQSATYQDELWAAPLTSNTQLLWYRTDRVEEPPTTWDQMIEEGEALMPDGLIQAQGERYEGLVVYFTSLLESAGGHVLNEDGTEVSLEEEPTRRALEVMHDYATSSAAPNTLSTSREDQARLAFEQGSSSFMVNYTFVWPSAQAVEGIGENMGYARYPGVIEGEPSRVTVGGINLGVGAFGKHPDLAREAAACLAGDETQIQAATEGGLLPSSEALYDDPAVVEAFPFADILRDTLNDAVQRPQTPYYNDVALAIARTLHPMSSIDPDADVQGLRDRITDALAGEGLL